MITRKEVARRFGVSVRRVRELEADHQLTAHLQPDRTHLFRVAEVEKLRQKRLSETGMQGFHARSFAPHTLKNKPRTPLADDPLNAVAAQVFEALNNQVAPTKIVTSLRLNPSFVEELMEQWARMSRYLLVSPMGVEKLKAAGVNIDVLNVGDEEVMAAAMCVACKESTARFCGECRRRAVMHPS
jgi:hypothetical protein